MGGTTTSPTASATAFDYFESPALLLLPKPDTKPPHDSYHLAYIIYFIMGTGYLIPWNAFITVVNYFSYLYLDAFVDRVFAVVYMIIGLISLPVIVFFSYGTVASGVLILILRIFTKAVYSQYEIGLRRSANLYFIVSIVVMIICIVLHNTAHRLPVIKHYNNLKIQNVNDEKEEKGVLSNAL